MMDTAPIAIFVYNRPGHTEKMLESLLKNDLVSSSKIYVFCDGAKNDQDIKNVCAVNALIKNTLPQAELVESKENKGLANSIIQGVSYVLEQYEDIIVLEDDLVLSPSFLKYMNEALSYYRDYDDVMHISSYLPRLKDELPDSFFYREPSPWGWATWGRAWKYFRSDSKELAMEILNNKKISQFNQGHTYFFWEMLCRQYAGEVDSWAIRWYASMFVENGLSLYSGNSLVNNIGFDGSGTHCSTTNIHGADIGEANTNFTNEISESRQYCAALKHFRTGSILKRMTNYLKHHRQFNKNISKLGAPH